MKNEITIWLKYAGENLESAKLLLDSRLYNSCLQNTQQAVEKYLKAFLISNSIKPIKTHSIRKLKTALDEQQGTNIDISGSVRYYIFTK
jgi:HEPN domain-containing protein